MGQCWEDSLRRYALAIQNELVACASSSAIVGRYIGKEYLNVGIAENYFWAALNKRLPVRNTNQEGMK